MGCPSRTRTQPMCTTTRGARPLGVTPSLRPSPLAQVTMPSEVTAVTCPSHPTAVVNVAPDGKLTQASVTLGMDVRQGLGGDFVLTVSQVCVLEEEVEEVEASPPCGRVRPSRSRRPSRPEPRVWLSVGPHRPNHTSPALGSNRTLRTRRLRPTPARDPVAVAVAVAPAEAKAARCPQVCGHAGRAPQPLPPVSASPPYCPWLWRAQIPRLSWSPCTPT